MYSVEELRKKFNNYNNIFDILDNYKFLSIKNNKFHIAVKKLNENKVKIRISEKINSRLSKLNIKFIDTDIIAKKDADIFIKHTYINDNEVVKEKIIKHTEKEKINRILSLYMGHINNILSSKELEVKRVEEIRENIKNNKKIKNQQKRKKILKLF